MKNEDLEYLKDTNWFNKSLDHSNNNELAQALISVNFYMEEKPDSAEGKILKARINTSLANYEESERLLNSIDLGKNNSNEFLRIFYGELASLHRERNEFQKAADCYQKIIEIDPNYTGGYIMKGAVLATLGKFEEAKKLHLQATRLEGDPDEAFLNLGLILRAELKLEEAKEAFENALELCPNEERLEKELEDVEKAIKLRREITAYRLAKNKIN